MSSNNTPHIFACHLCFPSTSLFPEIERTPIICEKFYHLMCPPLLFSHHHIEINIIDTRHFALVYLLGITRLKFIQSTEQELSKYALYGHRK